MNVSEGDEAEASGPSRDGVLHHHRVLHRPIDLKILLQFVYKEREEGSLEAWDERRKGIKRRMESYHRPCRRTSRQ